MVRIEFFGATLGEVMEDMAAMLAGKGVKTEAHKLDVALDRAIDAALSPVPSGGAFPMLSTPNPTWVTADAPTPSPVSKPRRGRKPAAEPAPAQEEAPPAATTTAEPCAPCAPQPTAPSAPPIDPTALANAKAVILDRLRQMAPTRGAEGITAILVPYGSRSLSSMAPDQVMRLAEAFEKGEIA